MLSAAEQTDARRHMGYPAHGIDPAGGGGLQYYQASGLVEYRLSHLSAAEETVARRYLGTLAILETAIPETGAGLDTASAVGWVRNASETLERGRLFDDWRRRFCAFLGVPPGPGLSAQSSTVRLVV